MLAPQDYPIPDPNLDLELISYCYITPYHAPCHNHSTLTVVSLRPNFLETSSEEV